MNRNYIVQVYAIEFDGEEVQTGTFGPLTEQEADGWCSMFNNMKKATACTVDPDKDNWTLKITEMSNPWTFGIPEDLRVALYTK